MPPRVFVPHDYQQEARSHLLQVRRGGLWAPMGGGKTILTLSALEDLDLIEPVFPVLILAPLRVARSTWPDEVAKWAHTCHRTVSVVSGSVKEREAALRVEADIYTMNYDNLNWLVERYKEKWPFRTVVADELTRLKSFRLRQGGKRAGALGKVAHTLVDRFIGLTGTPAPKGLQDLWGQTWFIDKGERLGKTFTAFESRWFDKGWDGFSIKPKEHAQAEIEALLKDVFLTVKGLPVEAPVVSPIYVDLPPAARELYRQMEKEAFIEIEEFGVEGVNAGAKLNKLRQLCNGAIYVDDESTWREVHRGKIEALESIIEEAAGMPVLCSYEYVHDLERLSKHFRASRVLDAEPQTIRDWNAGKIRLLFAHAVSAGHGLNMADGGNILARFGLGWDLELHMQIIERIGPQRQAQAGYDRPVFDYPIIARGTIEEYVWQSLSKKRTVQEALLAAMRREPLA